MKHKNINNYFIIKTGKDIKHVYIYDLTICIVAHDLKFISCNNISNDEHVLSDYIFGI